MHCFFAFSDRVQQAALQCGTHITADVGGHVIPARKQRDKTGFDSVVVIAKCVSNLADHALVLIDPAAPCGVFVYNAVKGLRSAVHHPADDLSAIVFHDVVAQPQALR